MDILDIRERLEFKRWKLVHQTDIPDVAYYSRQWAALAVAYAMIGFDVSAATCRSNAKRYGEMAGSWRRIPTAPVVTLEYVGG